MRKDMAWLRNEWTEKLEMRLWVCNISLGFTNLYVMYIFTSSLIYGTRVARIFSMLLSFVSPIVISSMSRNQGRNFTIKISSSDHMICFSPKLYFFPQFLKNIKTASHRRNWLDLFPPNSLFRFLSKPSKYLHSMPSHSNKAI